MTKRIAQPPLTPAVLHILLALSGRSRHGYAIMKEVEADSAGRVRMGPGTLYGSLARMIEAGLIRESAEPDESDAGDARRIYYALTAFGRSTLDAELARYRDLVDRAGSKGLTPGLAQADTFDGG